MTETVGGRRSARELPVAGRRHLEGSAVGGDWFVIPGSGTRELTGVPGCGGFTAELGQHASITLDYWFE